MPELESDKIDFNKMQEDVMKRYIQRHNTRTNAMMRVTDMEVENRVQIELMKKELNDIKQQSSKIAQNAEKATNSRQLDVIEKKNNENKRKWK